MKKAPIWHFVFALCAFIVAIIIFILTEQLPDISIAESKKFNDLLVDLFGNIPFLYDKKSGLWLGTDIRHWAHTAEFFLLGVFSTLTLWFAMKPKIIKTGVISFVFCATFSLVDQCHKLFVPGRHFDGFDLVMDALGYGIAILIILLIALLSITSARHAKS